MIRSLRGYGADDVEDRSGGIFFEGSIAVLQTIDKPSDDETGGLFARDLIRLAGTGQSEGSPDSARDRSLAARM